MTNCSYNWLSHLGVLYSEVPVGDPDAYGVVEVGQVVGVVVGVDVGAEVEGAEVARLGGEVLQAANRGWKVGGKQENTFLIKLRITQYFFACKTN